jgi:hypothetical protein
LLVAWKHACELNLMDIRSKLRLIQHKAWAWPVAAYLILAAYGIIDAAVYLQSPFSGRISLLICAPKSQGQAVCTVTIFGFREIYQRSFRSDEFIEAVYYNTVNRATMSDEIYDGITIVTKSGKINFVFPFQRTYEFEDVARDINRGFRGSGYPALPIIFIGFHPSLYKRAILLIAGLGILIWWSKKEQWSQGVPLKPVLKTRSAFANFAFSWWGYNQAARLIFYIPLFYIISPFWDTYNYADFLAWACYCHADLPSCGLVAPMVPFTPLICLLPLLAFASLQALVQARLLKSEIELSPWWVAAPALAMLPLAIGFIATIDCTNCAVLKYLLSGIGSYAFVSYLPATWLVLTGLGVYFLLVGVIQCLALRGRGPARRSRVALAWVFIPLINTASLAGSYWMIRSTWNLPYPTSERYIVWVMLAAVAIQDVVSALYAAWMVGDARHRCVKPGIGR